MVETIIFSFSIVIMIVFMLLINKSKKNSSEDKSKKEKNETSQSFINVVDIKDTFLYTKDKYIISYLKINPISIDLLSKRETKTLLNQLTAELSAVREEWRFLAVSRPVDIFPLVNQYTDMKSSCSDSVQKELLKNEIREISNYALSGEVIERQFYIMIWEKELEQNDSERDLQKRIIDFANKFESCNVRTEILKKPDIIRLGNLINNPAYATVEDVAVDSVIPFIKAIGGEEYEN